MSMIFPGMDPYLEHPQLWEGVHATLIVYLRDQLQPQLRPHYIAYVETRVYVEGPEREIIPDVGLQRTRPASLGRSTAVAEAETPLVVRVPLEVRESYVSIVDRRTGKNIVTVIELLSPSNKYSGPGRASYEAKQQQVLGSNTHLVEIDLLRYGPHVLAVPEWIPRSHGPYDYLVSVNRAAAVREEFELYRIQLRERLPRIRVPLANGDPDIVLDLQAVLAQVYEAGSYADSIDYDSPCVPPPKRSRSGLGRSALPRSTTAPGGRSTRIVSHEIVGALAFSPGVTA